MIKKEFSKKAIAIAFSILLIALIFSILIPPVVGVDLTIGDLSSNSVTRGNKITFHDVNITIEAIERIPFVELNFTIFDSSDNIKDYVRFFINGSRITTSSKFTISLISPTKSILASWYTSGQGYDISYGYYWGSTTGEGYGYGDELKEQVTISYEIIFDTDNLSPANGYYGKFFGNATLNSNSLVYNSTSSDPFKVGVTSSGGRGGGGSINTPPAADAGGPYTGAVGQPITLNGGASTDVDGSITGYKWDFTNDGIYDTDWISSATTSHSYGTPGSYTIKLLVQDDGGATATATAIVTITGAGKSAPIAQTNGPYDGLTSASIQFDGSKSYDPDGTIMNYTWDFGDGSKAYTKSPEHLYPNEGEYTITLTVTDNDDLTDEDTTTVIVLLDTDSDGWSDVLEVAYGTSETDPNDQPKDSDQDGIPDEDSPDGTFSGDPDDDNDGLSDEYEETLGSDPNDVSDVIEIQINGATYYLVDTDGNAETDTLFDPFTEQSTHINSKEGILYLDIDNDGIWDYIYDPATGESSVYSSQEEFPFALIIIFIIILIIVTIVILFKTGYLYVENVPKGKKKK